MVLHSAHDGCVSSTQAAKEAFHREQLDAGMLNDDIPRITFHSLPLPKVESSQFNVVVVDQRYTEGRFLANLLEQLRSTSTGTTVVGLNASFKAPFLRLMSTKSHAVPGMGSLTVYVYRRTADDQGRATPPSSSREDDRASQSSTATPDRQVGPRPVHGSGGSNRSFSAVLGLPDRPQVDIGDGVEGLSAGGFLESAGVAAEPEGEDGELDANAEEDEAFGSGLAGLSSPQGGALLRVKRKVRRNSGSHEGGAGVEGVEDAPWKHLAPPGHLSPGDIAASGGGNDDDEDEAEEEGDGEEDEPEMLRSGFQAPSCTTDGNGLPGSANGATGNRVSRLLFEERGMESGSASPQGDALRHTKMQQGARRRQWEQQHTASGLGTF